MIGEPKDINDVARVFSNVPVSPAQQKLIQSVTDDFITLGASVMANVPRCAGRTAALRKLWEAKVTCVDAIAKGGV